MKKRKKWSTLLAVTLTAAMFTGCAGKGGTQQAGEEAAVKEEGVTGQAAEEEPAKKTEKTGEKTDLLLWMPPFGTGDSLDKEFWTKALEPWAAENNVSLSIEITPWGNYEEKYLTGFSSGEGPDVGYMYLEMFNDFIEMDTLAEIDSYFTQEEKDNYLYYDKGFMKGGQYAIPFIVGNL